MAYQGVDSLHTGHASSNAIICSTVVDLQKTRSAQATNTIFELHGSASASASTPRSMPQHCESHICCTHKQHACLPASCLDALRCQQHITALPQQGWKNMDQRDFSKVHCCHTFIFNAPAMKTTAYRMERSRWNRLEASLQHQAIPSLQMPAGPWELQSPPEKETNCQPLCSRHNAAVQYASFHSTHHTGRSCNHMHCESHICYTHNQLL